MNYSFFFNTEGFDAKIIQQIIDLWPKMAVGLGTVWTEKKEGGEKEGREGKFLGFVKWGLEERVGVRLFRGIDKNVVICQCLWVKSLVGGGKVPISQKTMKLRLVFFCVCVFVSFFLSFVFISFPSF